MYLNTSTEISNKTVQRKLGRGPRVAGLTAREAEVLKLLHSFRDKLNTPYMKGEPQPGWCRPVDLGGTQQSHHSNTLRRLVRQGFAIKKPYQHTNTQASIYRISDAGQEAWLLYADYQRRLRHPLLSQTLLVNKTRS